MKGESTRWKKKWNPGLRVAFGRARCANCSHEFQSCCYISPSSDYRNHPRGTYNVCDNWAAADWTKDAYDDTLK